MSMASVEWTDALQAFGDTGFFLFSRLELGLEHDFVHGDFVHALLHGGAQLQALLFEAERRH